MCDDNFPETITVRATDGMTNRIRNAAALRTRRLGVHTPLSMSEFSRAAISAAIESEETQAGNGRAKAGRQ